MSSNNTFSLELINWYSINKRDLPWRNTNNAYFIWLSEIILQQTRVEQGLQYYLRFIERFPTIKQLADASEDEVLKLWEGLGYYSRARNLHFAANQIVELNNGVFPSDFDNILKLKGVGKYTASAIASFAFALPYPTIDGNVYRVLSRLFTESTPINSSSAPKIFETLVMVYFNKQKPAEFNQAMMEFGALICTPANPKCPDCPLRNYCMAFETKSVSNFPVKVKAAKSLELFFYFLVINQNELFFIEQRKNNGIWKKLYQFPLIEKDIALNLNEIELEIAHFFKSNRFKINKIHPSFVHLLTHRKLNITIIEIGSNDKSLIDKYLMGDKNTLTSLSFPIALRNYIDRVILK